MTVFLSKDLKRLFVALACLMAGFLCAAQGMLWMQCGTFHVPLLLLCLLVAACLLGCIYLHFRRQQQTLATATRQIERFLSGDTSMRIECESEGSLYRLFHAVNTLATTLNAHVDKEQQTKDFLKSTISDISHQLKTPLAALTIYNTLLQEESDDRQAARTFAEKSEREIARIEVLVQNLLKITRLDAGFIVMERMPVQIADMLRDVQLSFETRTATEGKTISLEGPEGVTLSADKDWLTEAVSNVIKNALDHTGVNGQIAVRWVHFPTAIQIRIEDNGCGIPQEDIHHIFKRFYRSQHAKDMHGLGLGLPQALRTQ